MPKSTLQNRVAEAIQVLFDLGMPAAQQNERSALCLLALVDLQPQMQWSDSTNPLMGITPIMSWVSKHYDKQYAPNTRETFRRQSMHQFVEAGIASYNPDNPARAVNSPAAVYQITPACLRVIQSFGLENYAVVLASYLNENGSLIKKYQQVREAILVPVKVNSKIEVALSAGEHSELIKSIWEEFGSRFTPGGQLIYVGDTGQKDVYFDDEALRSLNVTLDGHGKMPDVIIYFSDKNQLVLLESVTSHGPVDSKRFSELNELFSGSTAELVLVSCFPNRRVYGKFQEAISWGTVVWIADNPSHIISYSNRHFQA